MARNSEGVRLAYADLLRVAAMVAVVALHVSAGWLGALPAGSPGWEVASAWDGLTRWCVPVYIMLSGMFLLDPKKSLPWTALLRHIFRVAAALLFWGLFYELYPVVLRDGFSLGAVKASLWALIWGTTQYHLWFLYMILGLYLLTPLFRAFVRGADRSDFHWLFLVVFLFVFLLPFYLRLHNSQTLTFYLNKTHLNFSQAFPPLAYAGYYLAGYYLKTYTLNRLAEGLIYAGGILGAVVSVWGTSVLSQQSGTFVSALYSNFSPTVCLMAVAVFVLFRYLLGVSDEHSRKQRAKTCADIAFGVYLIHPFFLDLLGRRGLALPSIGPLIGIPTVVLAVFLPSLLLSWLLHKIPVVGRYLT